LEKVVEEAIQKMEPIVDTAMDCSIAAVAEFQCSECNSIVVRSIEGLEKNFSATCLNANCRAEYHARKNGETLAFEFVLRPAPFLVILASSRS
jgi:hypothetical protein